MVTLATESKNDVSMTMEAKGLSPTWDETTTTWDDTPGTWDDLSSVISRESKNTVSLSLESKL